MIMYELDINVFVSQNCLFSSAVYLRKRITERRVTSLEINLKVPLSQIRALSLVDLHSIQNIPTFTNSQIYKFTKSLQIMILE